LFRGFGSGRLCAFVIDIARQSFELIDKQERMQRRDFELLSARLADDLIVYADEMIAKLRKLRAIPLVRAGR